MSKPCRLIRPDGRECGLPLGHENHHPPPRCADKPVWACHEFTEEGSAPERQTLSPCSHCGGSGWEP